MTKSWTAFGKKYLASSLIGPEDISQTVCVCDCVYEID